MDWNYIGPAQSYASNQIRLPEDCTSIRAAYKKSSGTEIMLATGQSYVE